MLKHEENSEIPLQPAAKVRVTPEELATALSRIEARKDAGQRQVDGTIPIGEAVQQLGLDTTPEEVLAEVQAIRQEPMRTKKRQPSVAGRLVLALGLGGILLGFGLGENSLSQRRSHQAAKPVSVSSNAPKPSDALKPISLDPNLLVQDASGRLVMLSEIGDNQPVKSYYNFNDHSFQQYPADVLARPWTLIKHNSQVYVRGWIPRMSDQALQKTGADCYTNGESSIPITLPLNGFQVGAEKDYATEFHADNIHLDKHAYEKWQP